VLEQDTILTEEPRGDGPVADIWASAEYLRSVLPRDPMMAGQSPEPLRVGVLGAARIAAWS